MFVFTHKIQWNLGGKTFTACKLRIRKKGDLSCEYVMQRVTVDDVECSNEWEQVTCNECFTSELKKLEAKGKSL